MGLIGVFQSIQQALKKKTAHGKNARQSGQRTAKWDEPSGDTTLVAASKIVEVLMRAIDENSDVRISFAGSPLEYKTHFLPERERGAEQTCVISSEYLRDRAYLLIGLTDPPEGIEKIKTGRTATLSFVQGGKLNEFNSSLLDAHGARKHSPDTSKGASSWAHSRTNIRAASTKRPSHGVPPETMPEKYRMGETDGAEYGSSGIYKMVFPEKIIRKALRRDAIRVAYSSASMVTLRIKNRDGYEYAATILEISAGGCSFLLASNETSLAEGEILELAFYRGEEKQVTLHGTLCKVQTRRGKEIGHVGFHTKSYEAMREMGELVTHMERIALRERHNLPPTETENLAELYRLTPSASTQEREARASRIRTV
ncbi:MAG: PilZ domain-containing protein [Magnetococcus sp. YQC-5]